MDNMTWRMLVEVFVWQETVWSRLIFLARNLMRDKGRMHPAQYQAVSELACSRFSKEMA
jgi:hypothetical protein